MRSIFISYSSKDIKIAEKIEDYLLKNNFSVWRDKSNIRANWSKEIAEAVAISNIILLIWSENSSQSDWVKNEWLTARALGKPIVPLLLSMSENLPRPLQNLEGIEFSDINIKSNFQRLLNFLVKLRESMNAVASKYEYEYEILPSKIKIPYSSSSDFTGRNTDLLNIYIELIGNLNKQNYSIIGLTGIGGVGKSQLAVEFGYRFAFQFEAGIYWIQGSNPQELFKQLIYIAKYDLELEILQSNGGQEEQDKLYFNEFYKYCKKNGTKMLLVIDNVVDPSALNDDSIFDRSDSGNHVILTLGCNILFTTRRDVRLPGVREYQINPLTEESCNELLERFRKPDSGREKKFSKKLCNSVGYLPLAIVLIGSYLKKYLDVTMEVYYEEIIKDKLGSIDLDQISKEELATRHIAAIRATFEPEWKVLEQGNGDQTKEAQKYRNSKKLVSILSLLSESQIISKNRLFIYSGIEKVGKSKLIRPAQESLNLLDELNLVDILEEGKSVQNSSFTPGICL